MTRPVISVLWTLSITSTVEEGLLRRKAFMFVSKLRLKAYSSQQDLFGW